ncbi:MULTISPECIES: WhiB family transcriptional regulator [Kitasatospora]|uniref:Transcriptional regulator WhiB n=1 Tax=Kitasatospora cystarginea TaxID=58350 RepID=A0ABN3DE81_9ACTN
MSDASRLPGAFEDRWEWQYRAACRDADFRLFFHPPGERGPAHDDRDAAAKRVCAHCAVRTACLEYALDSREAHGVWGGLTVEERRAALRTRQRTQGPERRRAASGMTRGSRSGRRQAGRRSP